MNRQISVVVCSAVVALMTLSSNAIAQQKTAKACQEEWRANKAANQANGVTEKAYVATCRGGAAPTTTAAPAAAPAPSAAAPQAASGQKTAKACQEEWRANKAANQANGVTEKSYVATCRGGAAQTTSAAPAAAPAVAPTAAAPGTASGQKTAKECREEWRANKAANQTNGLTEKAYVATCRGGAAPAATAAPAPIAAPAAPAPTAATPPTKQSPPPTSTAKPASTASGNPAGANQFSTEAQAKARCPADTVVWANLRSKIYHFSGTKNYGNTKNGAYMCERDTAAEGIRAAKNETHP
jgi:hypothetical protein